MKYHIPLLVILMLGSNMLYSQTSTTIKVTHVPGKSVVDGKSIYDIPDWQPTRTTNSNCFPFLDIKVYHKAKSKSELQYKVEVTNNSPYNLDITCSRWGFGNGGRRGIRTGQTSSGSGSFTPEEEYPAITFEEIAFQFPEEVQEEYGVYVLSDYIKCGETASSYLSSKKQSRSSRSRRNNDNTSKSSTANIQNNSVSSQTSDNTRESQSSGTETFTTTNNSSNSSYTREESSNSNTGSSSDDLLAEEQRQREAQIAGQRRQESQRRQQEYNQRIAEQTKKNQQIAAGATAASAGIIYVLGGLTYGKMGYADDVYSGRQLYFDADYGYSITHVPMLFNSIETSDRNGSTFESTETELSSASTLNYGVKIAFGYEHEYGGGEGFAYGQAGFLPLLFDRWNVAYGGGFRLYGGYTWVKLFADWSWGGRLNSLTPWILPEQSGSGKLNLNNRSLSWGLKFTFFGLNNNRNHMYIGAIRQFLSTNETENFRIYYFPDQSPFGSTGFEDIAINGVMFEWHKEHYFKLYLNLFMDYPIGGIADFTLPNEPPTDQVHFEIGFVRNLRIY